MSTASDDSIDESASAEAKDQREHVQSVDVKAANRARFEFERDRPLVAQMAATMYAGILMTSIERDIIGEPARKLTRALCVDEAFAILELIDARRP